MKPSSENQAGLGDSIVIEDDLMLLGISRETNVRLATLSFWLRTWKPDWVMPFPDGTHFRLLFFND